LNVAGKKVLEIGLGEGAESERLIRQAARWSGVDLIAEALEEDPDPADVARASAR
jgi:cyclopropane fatty-acyl-phospholipid synthase-like methyltransferase